ncbi:MAG: helix-turn-helix domain-containing protein [Clostridiales bacterium]|nr:helix-turn-helix domain-containing protein [Clostridiales bacterium]
MLIDLNKKPNNVPEHTDKLYITVAMACERYSIGRTTLYELFKLPDCPTIRKLGGKTLIPVKEFDEFILRQMKEAG